MFNGLADRVSARRVAYQRFTVLWITHWSYDTRPKLSLVEMAG